MIKQELTSLDTARMHFEKMLHDKKWHITKDKNGDYVNPTVRWMWLSFLCGIEIGADHFKRVDKT